MKKDKNRVDQFTIILLFCGAFALLTTIDNSYLNKFDYFQIVLSATMVIGSILYEFRFKVAFYIVKFFICVMFIGFPLGTIYAMYLFPKLEEMKPQFTR